jgi:hypothetical protein
MNSLIEHFRTELQSIQRQLENLPEELAQVPWAPGKWTRAELIGHLADSSANNRQRFVRASLQGHYQGPNYDHEGWVTQHGYREQKWSTLLQWWTTSHDMLISIVERIPEERLNAECLIGEDAPVTLRNLIEDYVRHQQHHLRQMQQGL